MNRTIATCSNRVLILGEADVRRCLRMRECLDVNRRALISIGTISQQGVSESIKSESLVNNESVDATSSSSSPSLPSSRTISRGVVPTRLALPFGQSDWTLFKPAAFYENSIFDNNAVDETSQESVIMGLKVVSVRSKNPEIGKPLVPATILLLDAVTGEVNAVISATYLTAARTAAGSALATRLCWELRRNQQHQQREANGGGTTIDFQHLVVFGAGLQAECHIEALETCMQQMFDRITIVNRSFARAEALRDRIMTSSTSTSSSLPRISERYCDIILLESTDQVQEALSTADVVVATTNTKTPLWDGKVLKAGCHVNGIGSYTPEMQEVDETTVNRCQIVFIDTNEAKTVGDLKHLQQPHMTRKNNIHLLGDALANPDATFINLFDQPNDGTSYHQLGDCTFYKAVGTAIQDVMTASLVVERAKELDVGTYVDM